MSNWDFKNDEYHFAKHTIDNKHDDYYLITVQSANKYDDSVNKYVKQATKFAETPVDGSKVRAWKTGDRIIKIRSNIMPTFNGDSNYDVVVYRPAQDGKNGVIYSFYPAYDIKHVVKDAEEIKAENPPDDYTNLKIR